MKRGWFPPSVDPTKVGAAITTVGGAVTAVVLALSSKTTAAWTVAANAVFSALIILGLVRPNVTPVSDPRDGEGNQLVRKEG